MPATKDGPANCRSGGSYHFMQLCIGAPRCKFDADARAFTQAQPKGCGMCRREFVFLQDGEKMPELTLPTKMSPPEKHELSISFLDLRYYVETRRLICGDVVETCGPTLGRLANLLVRAGNSPVSGKRCRGIISDGATSTLLSVHMNTLREKLRRLGYDIYAHKQMNRGGRGGSADSLYQIVKKHDGIL